MAYTINKTDGTVLATITDGTINNSSSLTLFGKSYSGFGEALNENLVKLLENQSSTAAPASPLKGELWFDNNTAQLKVYDGTSFKPTGGSKSQASQPTSASAGDLFHDTDDDQVYVYTGSAWLLVGPTYTSGQTLSGWKIETLGSAGGNKVVSSMYAGNTRVCILSKETFTPTVSQTGFASIKAGLTLNSTLGAVFEGTNTQATAIDVSSTTDTSGTVIAGGNFLRANANDATTGSLTINNNTGLILGGSSELTVSVSSNDISFAQTEADKDIIFKVNDSDGGGAGLTVLTLDGSEKAVAIAGNVTITGNLTVSGSYDTSSTTTSTYTDTFIQVNTDGGDVDGGLIVNTPDTNDARIYWEASGNRWLLGYNNNYSEIITHANSTTNGATGQGLVLKTDSSGIITMAGIEMSAVGSALATGDTGDVSVPTIGQVVTFGNLWGGSAKTVSTSDPSGGSNGDFWFKYTA